MKNKIPYGSHYLDNDDIDSVVKSLKKFPITQGQLCEDFGSELASYTGANFGVAVSSGTAALHLALAALDIGEGDEIITCPMTFCATSNAILYQKAKPVFVDIDLNTLNIDVTKIEEKINKNTKAIMPIDFRGHPCDIVEIKRIADKYKLKVIQDGSHSLGSCYRNNDKIHYCGDGTHADMTTFSFHPVKHITTGEGGAVLTNDKKLFKKLHALRKHGIDRRKEMFSSEKRIGEWYYEMESLGYNYRMNEFQAALGLSQLKKLEKFKTRRREIVNIYNEELKDIDEIILPFESNFVDSNFHIYVLQIKNNKFFDRYDFFNFMRENDYLPMIHYIPVHLLKFYRENYGYKRGDFPNCEKYYDRTISIPFYPSLTNNQIYSLIKIIKDYIKKSK